LVGLGFEIFSAAWPLVYAAETGRISKPEVVDELIKELGKLAAAKKIAKGW
jgi:hypothetical protein